MKANGELVAAEAAEPTLAVDMGGRERGRGGRMGLQSERIHRKHNDREQCNQNSDECSCVAMRCLLIVC